MKKLQNVFKVGLVALLSMSMLSGCTLTKDLQKQDELKLQQEQKQTQEYRYLTNGTFFLDNGKVVEGEYKDSVRVLTWYIDPSCPSCTKLDEILKPRFSELNEKLVIRFVPMGFLSPKTLDDYSNRASAFILAVAEAKNELALDFLHTVMSESFRPQIGEGVETPDEKFKEAFVSLGGTEEDWKVVTTIQPYLLETVKENTAKAFNDKDLIAKAPNSRITVPFLIVGNSEKALDFSTAEDVEKFVFDSVDSYLHSMPQESQVAPTESTNTEDKPTESKP